jgi:hypothetical protein
VLCLIALFGHLQIVVILLRRGLFVLHLFQRIALQEGGIRIARQQTVVLLEGGQRPVCLFQLQMRDAGEMAGLRFAG